MAQFDLFLPAKRPWNTARIIGAKPPFKPKHIWGAPDQMIAAADQAFGGRFKGRLDILVNNAGLLEFGSFLETTYEAYDRHFDLNVRCPMLLSRRAAERMRANGWGRIINIGSAFGEAVPLAGLTHYATTKFAIRGFTKALSRELGMVGITVNAVQPGPTNTDLSPEDGPVSDTMKGFTSVGRFATTREIASAVAFLADPQSAYVNGECLTVDGGWNA